MKKNLLFLVLAGFAGANAAVPTEAPTLPQELLSVEKYRWVEPTDEVATDFGLENSSSRTASATFYFDGIKYTASSKNEPLGLCVVSGAKSTTGQVTIPAQVTDTATNKKYTVIGLSGSCFLGSKATSITLPSTLQTVANTVFSGCSNLKEIQFPEGTVSIGSLCFRNCTALERVGIPASLITIGQQAFEGCTALKRIEFPNIASVLNRMYYCPTSGQNYNLTSSPFWSGAWLYVGGEMVKDVVIPQGTTIVNGFVLAQYKHLKSVTFPAGIDSIGTTIFQGCDSLNNVVWPNYITTIPRRTFQDCTNLSNLSLPGNLEYVGFKALDGTAWLNNQSDGLVMAGKAVVEYKGAVPEAVTIPDGALNIGGGAFSDKGIKTIVFPSTLKSIGEAAFMNCGMLKVANLPTSIESVEGSAFKNCYALENVSFSNNLKKLGKSAFLYCVSLKNVKFTSGSALAEIPDSCFQYCLSLNPTSSAPLTFPASTKKLGNNAFYGASQLKYVVFNEGLTWIGYNCFFRSALLYSKKSAEGIVIPNSVTDIRECSMMYNSYTRLTLGTGVVNTMQDCFGHNPIVQITCMAQNPPAVDNSLVDNGVYEVCKLIVPENRESAYRAAKLWSKFKTIVDPKGVEELMQDAEIEINNLEIRSAKGISVYDLNGMMVGQGRLVTVPSAGMYIIHTGGKGLKVLVK